MERCSIKFAELQANKSPHIPKDAKKQIKLEATVNHIWYKLKVTMNPLCTFPEESQR